MGRGRRLGWWLAGLLSLGAVIALVPRRFIAVVNSRTGDGYGLRRMRPGMTVQLSWTHSMEKTPWIERYQVRDRHFILLEAKVKSFGAGVDQDAPEVVTADGWVSMRGTGRTFASLTFLHSPDVGRRVTIGDTDFSLDDRVPADAPVEIRVGRAPALATALIRE